MSDTQLKVVGGFIVMPSGQQAVSVRHISTIRVAGREDPDNPRGKNAILAADVNYGDSTQYIELCRFTTFREAQNALEGLLASIAADAELSTWR